MRLDAGALRSPAGWWSRLETRGIMSPVHIRAARQGDLAVMQDIERAAGSWFREIGMAEIAGDEPLPVEELARYRQDHHAWVAADDAGIPAAYLIAGLVDGSLHIEQVSVHPRAACRKIGRMLLDHAAAYAAAGGIGALTLTTFAEVPWNAPYYARCGFRVLQDSELSPGMRAVRDREIAHGLHRWPRVGMRGDLDIPRQAGSWIVSGRLLAAGAPCEHRAGRRLVLDHPWPAPKKTSPAWYRRRQRSSDKPSTRTVDPVRGQGGRVSRRLRRSRRAGSISSALLG
jgi:ribosomal protein S18 acetylase RimI-like enzyme